MVTDAFKILGNHQKVECVLPFIGRIGNDFDKVVLHSLEIFIHSIILCHNNVSKINILLYIGVHTPSHHTHGLFSHGDEWHTGLDGTSIEVLHYAGNICRLITYAFKVGYHFHGGGDLS